MKTKFKETEIGLFPENWNVDILNNFLELITYGFTCPMPTLNEGPFMITATDLEGNKINYETARRTSEEAFQNNLTDKSRPLKNDILLSKDGTLGRVAIVKKQDLCISQSVALLRPSSKILPEFLYYLLLNPINQKKMESDSDGSVLKHIYITRVNKMLVAIPPLSEQKVIAKMLSDLDAKIECNQQMNTTLELIGKSLFRQWFVDFEFPNEKNYPYKSSNGAMVNSSEGKIPKEWCVKSIDEIAKFLNGLPLQKYPPEPGKENLPVIKIRELRQGVTDSSDRSRIDIPKEYIVNDGDILFSWSGSLEVTLWAGGKGALNQHLFKVSSENYPRWFYYYWVLHYLPEYRKIAEGKATTMGHIQRKHLTDSIVLVPDTRTIERMSVILIPIFEKIMALRASSRTFTELRISLLSKLMSGEIRVPV